MRRAVAELHRSWLCIALALVLAGCAGAPGRVAGESSSQPPAPSSQGPAAPSEQSSVTATVTPAPTGTPATAPSDSAPPSPPPAEPTAGATSTAEPNDPSPAPPDSPAEPESIEDEVVRLTNEERVAAGCPEVQVDDRLVAAARGHSADMIERDFFDHVNPDGAGPGERARSAGYEWLAISENIAWGQPTAKAVVAGWMDSSGHRRNILDCDMVAVGVGVAESSRGPYWTQMFGRR